MSELSTAAKRELLARLLRQRAAAAPGEVADAGARAPELTRVSRENDLAASSGQERWWFQEQLMPESVSNMLVLLGASGPVDHEALRRSVATVVERHESLRTVYPMVDGHPLQRITPFSGWSLPLIDLRHLGDDERQEEMGRRSRELVQTPFDLETGPVFRTELLRMADNEYLLVSAFHHIVSDGWSVEVYFDELAACYAAYSSGGLPRLPELSIQYADYAQWQRTLNSGEFLNAQRHYWMKRMGGQLPVLEPPTDHLRPGERSFAGQSLHTTVDQELLAGLRELSRREGVTLFTTLLAAFQALLVRHTGQEDLLVGTFVAGRARPEIEQLIGFFVNTLALRTDFSGNPTFREALGRTRDVVLGAHSHADFPFDKLIQELHPTRDLGRNPVMRVFFNKISIGRELAIDTAGVRLRLIPSFDVHSVADGLTLFLSEGRAHVDIWYVYGTELYEADTIARLAGHLPTLLAGVVANPDQRILDLPLLLGPEEARLRILGAGRVVDRRGFVPFHRRFEQQAATRPHAVALSSGDDRRTYAQLNARANRVAHRLRSMGAGPGALVGVHMGRTPDMVAALLGIQKTGAAYVPLDPGLPGERLAFMLADSGVRVVVCGGDLRARMDAVELLDLDREDSLHGMPEDNLETAPGPDDRVYVIYTSGSTGRPKGVTVLHRGLANFLEAMLESPGLVATDVLAAVTTISFDISGLELYLPLLAGARVELVSAEEAADGIALASRLTSSGATLLQGTPATWRLLLEAGWEGGPGFRAFSAGEALPRELANALVERTGELWNLYGPTETTIYSTVGRIESGSDPVHAGRPIANTRIHILDSQARPVPIGAWGELWIGGDGVAAGYHRRPELTAERFVADWFSGEAGATLYRTGDRCRWRADGTLELSGRLDSQVKLRGFRIELGEIEAVLAEHPRVRGSAVAVREDLPGGAGLVAYLVTAGEPGTLLDEVRRLLRVRLPDYMIPSRIVLLERLPLSHNGKLDRASLPAPDPSTMDVTERFAPLQGRTEEALGAIWRDVLGVDRVGRSDNFFELGGHSLLAMRVIARLRDAFGGEISVRRMFEMQTISEMATHLDQRAGLEQRMSGPIPRRDPQSPQVLSSAQERLWFFDQLEPGSSAYNIFGTIQFRGRLELEALQASLDDIMRRHEALRTTFPAYDGRPVQRVHPPRPWPLRVIDLRGYAPELRDSLALRHSREQLAGPFDLVHGPVVRAQLVRTEDELHFFGIAFHHIVADAWSIELFVRELAELYAAHSSGRAATLTPLPIQYADFAAWQQRWLSDDAASNGLDYWTRQLAGLPPALDLPLDFPRPLTQTFAGEAVVRLLAPSLRDRLEVLSRAEQATLFMTLLAVLDVVLGRLSGQRDVCVGVPVAGRVRTETEGLIGVFINTLVLRTRLEEAQSFRTLLKRVRETALGAFAHEELPFERLVEEIQPERDLSRTPLYQVMLNMVEARGPQVISLPGLVFEAAPIDPSIEVHSKFDLTLYAADEAGGLRLALAYNTQLFSPDRMEALLDQLMQLLEEVAADPALDVMSTSLVTPALTPVLPDPTAPLGRSWSEPVHQRFRRYARNTPDRTAVIEDVRSWTYGELDERSDRLARYLAERGIGREAVVAVYAHRSAGLVWAMLGILKAGAGFVVIDPAYPAERTVRSLQQARPAGWIHLSEAGAVPAAIEEHLAGLPDLVRAVWSPAEETPQEWERCAASPPEISVDRDDLAYLVFTSGSTGIPKGIVGTHGPLSHFFDWHARTFHLGEEDRFSVLSGLSHDPLLRDVLGALWAGATICMPDSREFGTPGYLARWMGRQRVTVAHLTPGMATLLSEAPAGTPAPGALRLVCFGGDVLPRTVVESVRRMAPAATLVNFYGASETPQAIAWHPLSGVAAGPATLPVGRGIDEAQLLIINPSGGLAGIGELGEIHVRTPHLARGYLGDAALTAERFIANPFGEDPADRLYRTGDAGRYRPDGTVEFAGRADQQVKIRGYRVEPGDVEAALRGLPGVGQVIVVAQSDRETEPALTAFVVASGLSLDPQRVREQLGARLPDYMVPAQVVVLDAIPLTPNGKLDRARLPRPAEAPAAERVAPRTPVEEIIAAAWSEVLGHSAFGVHDNFFVLGGHSLMATRVLSRLEARLHRSFPVRVLFESPTVAELAARVDGLDQDIHMAAIPEREEISL